MDRPSVIKRILAHLASAGSAVGEGPSRAPPTEATSSASDAGEGEGASPSEPHYEPLFDDLPIEDLPINDGPQDDLPFDDSPPDDLALGDSA